MITIAEWFKSKSTLTRKELVSLYDEFKKDTGSKLSLESYSRTVRRYSQKFESKVNDLKSIQVSEETTDDTYKAFVTSTYIKTPEQLMEYLKIDKTKWELTKFTRNIWGSESNPSVQIKGEFKVRPASEPTIAETLEIIKNSIEEFKPVIKLSSVKKESDNMLEIAIHDQHFGQRSLSSETGEDYNLDIAHDSYIHAVSYFLNNSKTFNISKVSFIVGSDFFNVDNPSNTTYAGTPQDEISSWKDTFEKGLQTCIEAIELCYSYVPNIDVLIVQGNHDYTRSFYLGVALKQRYCNSKNITVDVSHEPRKYEVWGKNLICFTHGDKESMQRLPVIISKERPIDFSNAKFIEAHCGHLHAEKNSLIFTNEDATIKYRVLPSLVPDSTWAKEKGYFHTRESKAFIWNKEKGNIVELNYNV